MLDEKDLEAIGKLLDEKLEVKLEEKLDKKLESMEKGLKDYVEERVVKSESMLLDEMDRMKGHLDEKIDRIDRNVEEMRQYYRIDKLENQTITIMMRSIDDLRKDVDELKEVVGA